MTSQPADVSDDRPERRLYEGQASWTGPEMARSQDWIYRFSEPDLEEIEAAVAGVQGRGLDILNIDRRDFALPRLADRLREIQDDVVGGRGFVLLRGLPVERWSRLESALAFWGIGRHFGDPLPQNAKGHLLGHVKDIGKDPHNPADRVYQTSYRHLFHTDSCDIVGLLCLRQAKSGGLSRIVSSTSLYNEIERRRPDLAAVLAEPFTVDRKGEIPDGKGPYYQMSVFHHHAGRMTAIYARDFIEAAQRFADVSRLTDAQREAMDMLDDLADSPAFHLDMEFEPGDIQFLHNHQILHARTAYEDHPEPERRRHLLRLWLSAPNGRELPPVFAERYGEIAVGPPRGGIRVPGGRLSAPLDAE
jgi:hypothetical protein